MVAMFLDAVAIQQPKSVIPYDKQIIEAMGFGGFAEFAETVLAGVLAKLCIDQVRNLYLKCN